MLSDLERDHVFSYLDYLLEFLRLTEWVIIYDPETTEEYDRRQREDEEEVDAVSASARLTYIDGRYCAVLRLTENWEKYPAELQRDTLVHEVLHLIHNELTGIFYGVRHTSRSSAGILGVLFEEQVERMTDRMAGCLSPLLPQYPLSETRQTARVKNVGDWA